MLPSSCPSGNRNSWVSTVTAMTKRTAKTHEMSKQAEVWYVFTCQKKNTPHTQKPMKPNSCFLSKIFQIVLFVISQRN